MRKKRMETRLAGGNQPLVMQKLLTVIDMATILGLSKVNVYALLKQRPHGLPSVKIDGTRRFQPKKLQAWIEQQSEEVRRYLCIHLYLTLLQVGSEQATHFVGKGILRYEPTGGHAVHTKQSGTGRIASAPTVGLLAQRAASG